MSVGYFLTSLTMKKQDFIKELAAAASVSQAVAGNVLEAFIGSVTAQLKKGEEVNITGFGAFKVSKRAARNGVNPRTGAKLQIAASKSPVFRAGKTLKDSIK